MTPTPSSETNVLKQWMQMDAPGQRVSTMTYNRVIPEAFLFQLTHALELALHMKMLVVILMCSQPERETSFEVLVFLKSW